MANQNDATASQLLGGHFEGAVKTYSAYDGSNRLEFLYVAGADMKEGEKCMSTQYVYDGTSTRVTKTNETLELWQEAWDI